MSLGERPLRAGYQATRRDVGFVGVWALSVVVVLLVRLAVTVPDWVLTLVLVGTGLQALGVLLGLFLRTPTRADYADRKNL